MVSIFHQYIHSYDTDLKITAFELINQLKKKHEHHTFFSFLKEYAYILVLTSEILIAYTLKHSIISFTLIEAVYHIHTDKKNSLSLQKLMCTINMLIFSRIVRSVSLNQIKYNQNIYSFI